MTQNWKEYIQQFPISNPSAKMLVDLSHFGIIQVSGTDAAKFLQGQLTCDVAVLQSGQHTLGAYCNIKGRVESLFRLWRAGNKYFLRMPDSLVEATLQELKKYAIFSKVELINASESLCGFGMVNQHIDLKINNPELSVLEINQHHRYDIYGHFDAVSKLWQECTKQASQVDPYMWDILEVENKIPELYPETVGEFFPHDLNLPNLGAVSFTKGCFRGQEIIARMQHRGKIKRNLYAFNTMQCEIKPGDKVTAGGPEQELVAGTVVRACTNTNDRLIGLAVITNSMIEQPLYVDTARITLT